MDVLTQGRDVHLRSRVDVSFLDVPYRGQNVVVEKHYKVKTIMVKYYRVEVSQ